MGTKQELKVFGDKQIRTYWDDVQERWFFCIADVVEAITDSSDVRQYIKRLRQRDAELGAVWGTICTPPSISLNGWEITFRTLFIAGIQAFERVDAGKSPG